MPVFRITFVATKDQPREIEADSFQDHGEFLQFWSDKIGQVLLVRKDNIKLVDRIKD